MGSPSNTPVWKQFNMALKRNFNSYCEQDVLSHYECNSNSASNINLGKGIRKRLRKRVGYNNPESKNDQIDLKERKKKKEKNKRSKYSQPKLIRNISFAQDLCEVQMMDHSTETDSVMAILNSPDIQPLSSFEQLPPSDLLHNQHSGDNLKELVRILLKNQHELDQGILELDQEFKDNIDCMVRSIPEMSEKSYTDDEFLSYFPLNSIEDFDIVNELLSDCDRANALIELLGSAVGPTVRKCVNGMMKLLFRDSLCIEVGLTSQNRKKSFQNTKLMKCLYNAVSKRKYDLTLKELHFCVSDWFRRYKDRLYGKIRPSQYKNRDVSSPKNRVPSLLQSPDSNRVRNIFLNSNQCNEIVSGKTCDTESSICSHHLSFIEEKAKTYKLEKEVNKLEESVHILQEESLYQKKEISLLKDKITFLENLRYEILDSKSYSEENLEPHGHSLLNHSCDSPTKVTSEILVKKEFEEENIK